MNATPHTLATAVSRYGEQGVKCKHCDEWRPNEGYFDDLSCPPTTEELAEEKERLREEAETDD